MTNRIGLVYTEIEIKLFDQVRFVMKTRQDNDVIDRISLVYAENETQLSRPI